MYPECIVETLNIRFLFIYFTQSRLEIQGLRKYVCNSLTH